MLSLVFQENEEEWIDYEQEEEIDYSSLRVQNLQIRYKSETLPGRRAWGPFH